MRLRHCQSHEIHPIILLIDTRQREREKKEELDCEIEFYMPINTLETSIPFEFRLRKNLID